MTQVFLLSPAQCGGKRAEVLLRPGADFELARRLRSGRAPLGEVMSFLSGLYFRGKAAYARSFARPPPGCGGAFVIAPGAGLLPPARPIDADFLRALAEVRVDLREPRYVETLVTSATRLATRARRSRVVLLGSVATAKYTTPLLAVFGQRLVYPVEFEGMGDMARGALMLRAASGRRELAYRRVSELSGA